MSDPAIGCLFAACSYLTGAIVFGCIQVHHNRSHDRSDPHYAEAWFIGALWYPLLVWTLSARVIDAFRPRKANGSSHAP